MAIKMAMYIIEANSTACCPYLLPYNLPAIICWQLSMAVLWYQDV